MLFDDGAMGAFALFGRSARCGRFGRCRGGLFRCGIPCAAKALDFVFARRARGRFGGAGVFGRAAYGAGRAGSERCGEHARLVVEICGIGAAPGALRPVRAFFQGFIGGDGFARFRLRRDACPCGIALVRLIPLDALDAFGQAFRFGLMARRLLGRGGQGRAKRICVLDGPVFFAAFLFGLSRRLVFTCGCRLRVACASADCGGFVPRGSVSVGRLESGFGLVSGEDRIRVRLVGVRELCDDAGRLLSLPRRRRFVRGDLREARIGVAHARLGLGRLGACRLEGVVERQGILFDGRLVCQGLSLSERFRGGVEGLPRLAQARLEGFFLRLFQGDFVSEPACLLVFLFGPFDGAAFRFGLREAQVRFVEQGGVALRGLLQHRVQPVGLRRVVFYEPAQLGGFGASFVDVDGFGVELEFGGQRFMLVVEGALALGELSLEGLVAFGSEDAAEYLAPLVGLRRKKFAEIALGDHDDAGELLAFDAEDVGDSLVDIAQAGDDRSIGHGERGIGSDLGHSFAAHLHAFVRGPARYGVDAAAVFEFQLDARLEGRYGEIAAQRLRIAAVAAGFAE